MPANADRLRTDLAAARYLDALGRDDRPALDALWAAAETDPELLAAFRDLHAGLVEEQAGARRPARTEE